MDSGAENPVPPRFMMDHMVTKLGKYLRLINLLARELRAAFLPASAVSVLLGCAWAWHRTGTLNGGSALSTLLGVLALHAGANTANDYFDHRSGADAGNTGFIHPFSGGSRLIQQGLLTPRAVLGLAGACLALGAAVGIGLALRGGWPVAGLGLAGLAGGFFYSAPPVRLASRGWGEPAVALLFGILPAQGAYRIQAGSFSAGLAILSLAPSLLILLVLLINEFPDAAADAAAGKRTWVVRLGRKRAARLFLAGLALWPAPILALIAAERAPAALLWGLTPGALIPWIAPIAARYYDQPRRLAPACALTIALHLGVSLALCAGLL